VNIIAPLSEDVAATGQEGGSVLSDNVGHSNCIEYIIHTNSVVRTTINGTHAVTLTLEGDFLVLQYNMHRL
jgi:hypothetical protein